MNRLWVQLTLAFGLVVIVAMVIVSLIINYQVNNQFRRFVSRYPQARAAQLLGKHYERVGSWDHIGQMLERRPLAGFFVEKNPPSPPNVALPGEQGATIPPETHPFVITDREGYVLYNTTSNQTKTRLPPPELQRGEEIISGGELVGYLVIEDLPEVELSPLAHAFLIYINRTLLVAGMVAVGLGALLGLLIAWGVASPLARLQAAARRISQGDLAQRVPEGGSAEVSSMARAFNEMAASLQQARQLQHNLLADISHELRTPLSVLQGNLQAILEDVYPLDKAEIATIYDETLMLSRLVNDLHELARAEAGQLSLSLQTVDMTPIVRRSAMLFGDLAAEKGITLDLALADGSLCAMADADRVQQVLHNFLSNALRYTPPMGTITIEVKQTPRDNKGECLFVAVADSGPGIAPDKLPHVFDRFWRADQSRSRDHGGSGLGLAIAKQLILSMGGDIGVESEPGQGSTFWLRLPAAQLQSV
jgi:two-component system OmpR family sensor kinase/two-component system sensor histidine kinase BaeS